MSPWLAIFSLGSQHPPLSLAQCHGSFPLLLTASSEELYLYQPMENDLFLYLKGMHLY